MMDTNSKAEALSFLGKLTFNVRTDLAKGRINNRDAIAYLIYKCGPLRLSEARDLMMTWRFGEATYTTQTYQAFSFRTHTSRPATRKVPKMGFSYAFNTSNSGGYGCVGENHMSRGNWMHGGEFGMMGRAHGPSHNSEDKMYLRRTYWYRAGKGVYAPTLECLKRMRELNIA